MLGAGSSGEHFVGALRRLDADVEITVVERELAGGECSYYACLPTKTLLRPTEVLAAARLAPGAAEARHGRDRRRTRLWWRDQVTDGRDDSWHAGWLADQSAELVRGDARVAAARRRRRRRARARVRRARRRDRIAAGAAADRRARRTSSTGRTARRSGRARSRRACSCSEEEPVGVELAQFFRRMGSEVTIVEHNEPPAPAARRGRGQLCSRERFEQDGIRVLVRHAGRSRRSERAGSAPALGQAKRSTPSACSSRPVGGRTSPSIGLEQLGVEITRRGVDGRRALAARATASGRSATPPVSGSSRTSGSTRRVSRPRTSPAATCAPTTGRSRPPSSPIRRSGASAAWTGTAS